MIVIIIIIIIIITHILLVLLVILMIIIIIITCYYGIDALQLSNKISVLDPRVNQSQVKPGTIAKGISTQSAAVAHNANFKAA